jgi:hypothetical protein
LRKALPENVRPLRGFNGKSGPGGRRLRANWPAELRFDNGRLRCMLVDISPAGARVRFERAKVNFDAARLIVRNLPPIEVAVAWRRHNDLGLLFVEEQPWVTVADSERFDPTAWLKRHDE